VDQHFHFLPVVAFSILTPPKNPIPLRLRVTSYELFSSTLRSHRRCHFSYSSPELNSSGRTQPFQIPLINSIQNALSLGLPDLSSKPTWHPLASPWRGLHTLTMVFPIKGTGPFPKTPHFNL
jgi:hypothetical protein